MARGAWARVWALVGALLLCACGHAPMQPDLAHIYAAARGAPDRTPLIVIPGLFGSKLRRVDTQETLWPGPWQRVLFSAYRELGPDGPALEAYELAEQVLGIDFYGPLLDTLTRHGGYRRTQAGQPPPGDARALYVFPYDWRQDNTRHAAALEALIAQIRLDHGQADLRVDLVAHSMGGLVARYYLRYGPSDVLDGSPQLITLHGASRVRKLVLLGTPNFGAISALQGLLEGEPIGLRRMPPELLAAMPSAYQLLPHPLAHWLIDDTGRVRDEPLYLAQTWERLQMGVFDPALAARVRAQPQGEARLRDLRAGFARDLERARRLAWMLSTPEPHTPIRYVLFGGNCAPTPARLLLSEQDGPPRVLTSARALRQPRRGVPYEQLMREPGDGRVTKPSLLARETLDPSAPQQEEAFLPLAYHFFLCERHDRLTSNVNFQDNLLHILLTPRLPWDVVAP